MTLMTKALSNWANYKLGGLVWMMIFLLMEIPAHFGWVPWPTLSRTIWDVENIWPPTSYIIEVFLVVLCLHLVFRLSVIALIAISLLSAIVLGVHFIWGVK